MFKCANVILIEKKARKQEFFLSKLPLMVKDFHLKAGRVVFCGSAQKLFRLARMKITSYLSFTEV